MGHQSHIDIVRDVATFRFYDNLWKLMAIFFSEGEQNNRGSPDCQTHKQKKKTSSSTWVMFPGGKKGDLDTPKGDGENGKWRGC